MYKNLLSSSVPETDTISDITSRFPLIRYALILAVVAATLLFSRVAMLNFKSDNVSDVHGFRQSQTALSIIYMYRGGPFLKYETPVVGYPWAIPFEFPLYQGVCAGLAHLLHTPIIPTARAVSLMCYGLTLLSGWFLLKELSLSRMQRLLFLAIALASPLYMFWSRTIMIETMALGFGVTSLYFTARFLRWYREREAKAVAIQGPLLFLAALVSMIFCALVKVTSFPPAALIVAALFGAAMWRELRTQRRLPLLLAGSALLLIFLPAVVAGLWTRFSDAVKAENTVGVALTSTALKDWNFGTLGERWQEDIWLGIFHFNVWDTIGGLLPALLAISLIFAIPANYRRGAVVSLTAYLCAPFLFTNLYHVHTYYACGSGLFLIGTVGWILTGLLSVPTAATENQEQKLGLSSLIRRHWRGGACLAVLFLTLWCQFKTYGQRYHEPQVNPVPYFPHMVDAVKQHSLPNESVIGLGMDWSAELPLYTDRRSLMLPSWPNYAWPEAKGAQDAVRLLEEHSTVGALVLAGPTAPQQQREHGTYTSLIKHLGFRIQPVHEEKECIVYAKDTLTAPKP